MHRTAIVILAAALVGFVVASILLGIESVPAPVHAQGNTATARPPTETPAPTTTIGPVLWLPTLEEAAATPAAASPAE